MSALTRDEIKQSVSMADLLDRYGIRHNRNKALCPFHKEKTPSLTIKGSVYHCFGCGAGGDIFVFVQQMENCDFTEALRILGGSSEIFKYKKPKPTEEQRREKQKEQICNEWRKCLDYIRKNQPPAMDIDLSLMSDKEISKLCDFKDEYVKQIHRLPYLEYLVFEGGGV